MGFDDVATFNWHHFQFRTLASMVSDCLEADFQSSATCGSQNVIISVRIETTRSLKGHFFDMRIRRDAYARIGLAGYGWMMVDDVFQCFPSSWQRMISIRW